MKIMFSLSGFTKGVKHLFDINSPEFREDIVGKPVYLDGYKHIGIITDVDSESDLIYAEIPDKEYNRLFLNSKGYNNCSFEIVREE